MQGGKPGMMGGMRKMTPAVFGTVSSVSGNTIMVSGRVGFGTSTPAVAYTVDATNAKVMKNNAAGTISSIVAGDTVFVQGTITGTNVVATNIRDGVMMGGKGRMASSTPNQIQGNGEPVVAGTISAISGNTITVSNKSNVTYTVDATNAKVLVGNSTSAIANLKVGDAVVIQGTVNGNSIAANKRY